MCVCVYQCVCVCVCVHTHTHTHTHTLIHVIDTLLVVSIYRERLVYRERGNGGGREEAKRIFLCNIYIYMYEYVLVYMYIYTGNIYI